MPGLPWGSLGWNCCSVPPAGGAGGKEGGPWWAEVTGGRQMMARRAPERSWRHPVTWEDGTVDTRVPPRGDR